MNITKYTFLFISMIVGFSAYCQTPYIVQEEQPEEELSKIVSFTIGYGYAFPGGDMSERYGSCPLFSLGSQYLSGKNYLFEFDFNLMFGNKVKEDVLANFRNERGNVIGSNGGVTAVFLRQRGFYMGGIVGKLFTPAGSQSGLRAAIGMGVLSHNIRVLDETSLVAQVSGDYLKGYDRLTRGFALKQQIGYEIHSLNGRINMNLVFEVTEGFTKSVRNYQFDTGLVTEGSRLDMLYTIRATWMLPVIRRAVVEKQIYY